MTRQKYKALRSKLYKSVGELGTLAEIEGAIHGPRHEFQLLDISYKNACEMLNHIDALGVKLGYVDAETNDLTDRRFKTLGEKHA